MVLFKEKRELSNAHLNMSSSRHGDAALDMAEFKAIVTASFDDIGNNIRALHPNRLAPPPSSDNDKTTTARRSPFSFLRKVKSHATSLLAPQQQQHTSGRSDSAALPSSRSFVPALVPARQPTPAPFASSLSRNLLTRALGKHSQCPHFPDVEPKSSFFDDDDDDEDDEVDRRFFPQTRRISTAPARPNSRLSSAFAAATPTLFGLSSPSVSTPSLIPEKYGAVRSESRADIVYVRAYLLLDLFFTLTFFLEAGIQIVTETQAPHQTLPPKVSIAPFQSLFPVKRPFTSHAILSFSPILCRLCRLWAYSSVPCIAWGPVDHSR